MLKQLDHIPDGLLDLAADQLHDLLGGPTLILLEGRQSAPLFVSVLMHGNETTGWEAMRKLLGRYETDKSVQGLPRSLILFIGNTRAAKHKVRHLPKQPDYNRVWPGTELAPCPEQQLMQDVVEFVREQGLFASVDIHNNTGLNPHYACVNILGETLIGNHALHLATLFGRTVVYFTRPTGVQSLAMAEICPAVTVECGKIGNPYSIRHTEEYIDACLHLNSFPEHPVAPHDIDLFHTTAIVKIKPEIKFSYAGEESDLQLIKSLDHYNFRELAGGTPFGKISAQTRAPFTVINENGKDVYKQYFEESNGTLITRKPLMPSMLTLDTEVIRQDCLCYIMERLNFA